MGLGQGPNRSGKKILAIHLIFVGEVKAHKLLLSLASEVFRAQFFGMLPESSKGRSQSVSFLAELHADEAH